MLLVSSHRSCSGWSRSSSGDLRPRQRSRCDAGRRGATGHLTKRTFGRAACSFTTYNAAHRPLSELFVFGLLVGVARCQESQRRHLHPHRHLRLRHLHHRRRLRRLIVFGIGQRRRRHLSPARPDRHRCRRSMVRRGRGPRISARPVRRRWWTSSAALRGVGAPDRGRLARAPRAAGPCARLLEHGIY